MKRGALISALLGLAVAAQAQIPTGPIGIYLNTSFSMDAGNRSGSWQSEANLSNARLELLGGIGSQLGYRTRIQLNKPFPEALDLCILFWQPSEKLMFQAGKIAEAWGGFEYDENPIDVYEFSEFSGNLDCFSPGAAASWYPAKGHELNLSVTSTHTFGTPGRFAPSPAPLTVALGWYGTLWDGLVDTRWGGGAAVYAKGEAAWRLLLGTRLNLRSFKVYLDLMGSLEKSDYLGVMYRESGVVNTDVHYLSAVVRADWNLLPTLTLVLKGRAELAGTSADFAMRQAFGSITSLEYAPFDGQDLRFFLAHNGRYGAICDHLVQAGIIYRIKFH